jgi:hypothetical protein
VLAVFNERIMGETLAIKDKLLLGIYLIILVLIAGNLLYMKTLPSTIGLLIVLAGIPFYYFMRKNQRN